MARRTVAWVVVVVALWAGRAEAGPSAAAEAKEQYSVAMRHYELGEYDQAIVGFKRAYELSAAPGLLFNLGQVYRMKKDWAEALRFYRTFLRLSPKAGNKRDVESLIGEMQANVEAAQKAESQRQAEAAAAAQKAEAQQAQVPAQTGTTAGTAEPVAPQPARVSVPVAKERVAETKASRRHARIVLSLAGTALVVGVGALAAGIAVGVRANGDADELRRDAATHAQSWDAHRQAVYRDGQSSAAAATALDVVGPVLMVTGAVVGYFGWRELHAAKKFAIVPTRGGTGMAWAF